MIAIILLKVVKYWLKETIYGNNQVVVIQQ